MLYVVQYLIYIGSFIFIGKNDNSTKGYLYANFSVKAKTSACVEFDYITIGRPFDSFEIFEVVGKKATRLIPGMKNLDIKMWKRMSFNATIQPHSQVGKKDIF